MRVNQLNPPREFEVGQGEKITLRDCGRIALAADEQVTFSTENGSEYDVARKAWGFYATPSTNGRLKSFGWRTALVKSLSGKHYVFLVERGKDADFKRYIEVESHKVVCWLDDDDDLSRIDKIFEGNE